MDLTNPQIIMRDKEIAQLRAENSQIKNDLAANHDGLLEALAKECERLANEIGANNGLVIEPYVWLRGEAAAHRARKERK